MADEPTGSHPYAAMLADLKAQRSKLDNANQRDLIALSALALRSAAVIFCARALPPFSPPKRPRSTAAGSFPWSAGDGSLSGCCSVAISTMNLAS